MRWQLQPLQPLQERQLQPPFGPSVDSLCHPWFATANLPYKFPIFWNFRRRLVRYYWYLCMEGISSLPWYDEANPVQLVPVVPARGGAEVALGIYYKTFVTYRTCMRGAPARPVRACCVRSCCTVVVKEHDLHTAPAQCNAKQRFYLHCTLQSSHAALHTSHLHFTFHTSNSTLLISSQLISSHFIWALLTSLELFSSHFISSHTSAKFCLPIFISSEHSSTFLTSPQLVSTHLVSSARQKAWDTDAFTQKVFTKYFVVQSLHPVLPSTTLYCKACTKHVLIMICIIKLAQSICQYYLVLQSLHKTHPSTTLHYKACTKHFPVRLRTTKLAQSTS